MASLEKSISLAEIPLLTRDQFMESYARSNYAREGARVMDNHVFVAGAPLTYRSRALPFITLLGLYTHYSGNLSVASLRAEGKPCGFSASIILRKRGEDLRDVWKERLGLEMMPTAARKESAAYGYGVNGGPYARLLHLLGYSTSMAPCREARNTKTRRGASLPPYLQTLIDQHALLDGPSRDIARFYLRDLIAAFFDTRVVESILGTSIRLQLISQHSVEAVRAQGRQMVAAMNIVYPDLQAHPEEVVKVVSEEKAHARYDGYITLTEAHIRRASTLRNTFPAKFQVVVTPRFSYQHWSKGNESGKAGSSGNMKLARSTLR